MLKYPYIKGTKDPDYSRSPTTNIKIPYYDQKFNVELYDMNGELLFGPKSEIGDRSFEDFIPKSSYIAPIIQCKGIWFVGGKFGVSFQLLQTVVRQPISIQGSCFVSLTNDDKRTLESINKKDEQIGLDDEDEEVDDEDEEVDDVAVEDSDEEVHQLQEEIKDEVKEELKAVVEEPVEKPKKKRTIKGVKRKVAVSKA